MIIHESEIETAVFDFCEKYNIQDLEKESQNRYNALLRFLQRRLFPTGRELKSNPCRYNDYDLFKVATALDEYIELCDLYQKEISVNGFSCFIGIRRETIEEWKDDSNIIYINIDLQDDSNIYIPSICDIEIVDGVRKLRCKRSNIHKKLIEENERSNSDMLATSSRTLGIIARLNHVHSWNMPGVRESSSTKALTARESVVQIDGTSGALLPDLSTNDNN